jgi:hypothetical protein
MNLAIVGAEQKAWDKFDEEAARIVIRRALEKIKPLVVVSGACPKGGADIWAVEEAKKLGIETLEFVPKNSRWEPEGFKARNIQIAESCDELICFVKPGDKYCHHCNVSDHFPNGGCWTAKKAQSIGKKVYIVRVRRLPGTSLGGRV